MSFNYGQKHVVELNKAKLVAQKYCKEHKIVEVDMSIFGGSCLTDHKIEVPKSNDLSNLSKTVAITYVPARNTIFYSFALAWAEIIGATDIFAGPNKTDYDTYPDCRPDYIESVEKMCNLATRAGVYDHKKFKIHTPLINMLKKEVVKTGLELGVDYSHTLSCYAPSDQGYACGQCSSCLIRLQAFRENNLIDPAMYQFDAQDSLVLHEESKEFKND